MSFFYNHIILLIGRTTKVYKFDILYNIYKNVYILNKIPNLTRRVTLSSNSLNCSKQIALNNDMGQLVLNDCYDSFPNCKDFSHKNVLMSNTLPISEQDATHTISAYRTNRGGLLYSNSGGIYIPFEPISRYYESTWV